MPIYEYRCSNCGYREELSLSIADMKPSIPCRSCRHPSDRVYSAPSIHFIGPGFHNTDYRTSKKPETKETPTPQETKAKADASKNSTSD